MVDGTVAEVGVPSEQAIVAQIERLHAVIDRLIAGLTYEADESGTKQFALVRIRALVSVIAVSAREYLFALPPGDVDRITFSELIIRIPDRLKKGVDEKQLSKMAKQSLDGDSLTVMQRLGILGDEQISVDGLLRNNFSDKPIGDWYYFGLLQDLFFD